MNSRTLPAVLNPRILFLLFAVTGVTWVRGEVPRNESVVWRLHDAMRAHGLTPQRTHPPHAHKYPHIVVLRPDVDPDSFLREKHCTPRHCYRHAMRGFAVEMDSAMEDELLKDPDHRVVAIEEDGPMKLQSTGAAAPRPVASPIPKTGNTDVLGITNTVGAGIQRLNLLQFPVSQLALTNIDVAVLDTGIDSTHPLLNVVYSADYGDGNNAWRDWNGHGTLVAGVVGASYTNAVFEVAGVLHTNFVWLGVAPGVRLWDISVSGPNQSTFSSLLAGMDDVYENSASISIAVTTMVGVNYNPFISVRSMVQALLSAGVIFIASAGNQGMDLAGADGMPCTWSIDGVTACDDIVPPAIPETMTVSAMDPATDQIAVFPEWSSNFSSVPRPINFVTSPGNSIDVAAPGVHILSTYPVALGSYAVDSGTSFAAPHVAGLVALYIAANGRAYTAQDVFRIRQAIIDHSLPQSRWSATNTLGRSFEPLAYPSAAWMPPELFPPDQLVGGSMTTNGFQLSFTTSPWFAYQMHYADSLATPISWFDLGGSVMGTGSPVQVLDPATTNATRFYRFTRTPSP